MGGGFCADGQRKVERRVKKGKEELGERVGHRGMR